MPFELGVAYALTRSRPPRKLFVFEARKRDLLKSLSDLRHFDPKRHAMDGAMALEAVYECFFSPERSAFEEEGRKIYEQVIKKLLPALRKGKANLFNKRSFLLLTDLVSTQIKKIQSRS